MRLAAFYAAVCLAGIAGLAAVQLGWQPTFVVVWDGRSSLYLGGLFAAPVFIAALALGGSIPPIGILRRLSRAPSYVAFFVPAFALMGVLKLSPNSGSAEIGGIVAQSIELGLGLGLVTGLLQSFEAKIETEDAPKEWQRHAWAVGMIVMLVVACLFLLKQARPRDDGEFKAYASLGDPVRQLVVGVKSTPLTGDKFGVLRITNGDASNALIMERSELKAVITLWTSAQTSQSPSWRTIGETSDTMPSDQGTLSVSAGDGIRLSIRSPHSSTVTYEVAPADMARVSVALADAERGLDN